MRLYQPKELTMHNRYANMCREYIIMKKVVAMEYLDKKDELSTLFMKLTNANRDYVLAVMQALTFAQNSAENPPPQPDDECKPA